ncbi:MAG: hypothetical protein ACRDJ2_12385 [Actinomycetota bacterium]
MTVFALSLVVVLVLIPGTGAALAAFRPGAISMASRLALCFGFGYAITALLSYLLAIVGLLTPAVFAVMLAGVSIGLWFPLIKRRRVAEHVRALRGQIREDGWSIALGLIVIVAIAVVRSTVDPLINIQSVVPFRYWADALEIADLGRFPNLSVQYGNLYPPANSKALFNVFNAAFALFTEDRAFSALSALVWLSAVGLAVTVWAAARELGLRYTSAVLPLLITTNQRWLNPEITTDLLAFRAEGAGRLLAFCVLILGIRVLRGEGGRRDWVLTGLLAGVSAGSHLVPLIVVVVMLAFYAIAYILLTRRLVPLLVATGAMGGVALLTAGSVLFLTPGDVAFEGAKDENSYRAIADRFDPNAFLISGERVQSGPSEVEAQLTDVADMFVHSVTDVPTGGLLAGPGVSEEFAVPVLVPLAAGFVLAFLMMIFFPHALKPIGVVAAGTGTTLVLIAYLFMSRYDTAILTTFGVRRLFDYSALIGLLPILAIVEAGFGLLAKRSLRITALMAAVMTAAVLAALLPSATAGNSKRGTEMAEHSIDLLDWIRLNTPCDSRILANQRTVGVFKALTGRVAILEGMTPYLRPDMLGDLVKLMLRTQRFFDEPQDHASLLKDEAVDYVVVPRAMRLGHAFKARATSDLGTFPALSTAYDGEAGVVYRVEDSEASSDPLEGKRLPAIVCRRDEIDVPN